MLIRYKKNKINTWDENYSSTVRIVRDETSTMPYRNRMALNEVKALVKNEPLIMSPETMKALENVLDKYQIALDFDDIDEDNAGAVVAHVVLLSVGYEKKKSNPTKDHIEEDSSEENVTVSMRKAG